MRDPGRQISYLVGTPKSRIKKHEQKWLDLPWRKVRDSVEVKLFEQDGETYVLAKSEGRQAKEIAMRRKRIARLLRKLRAMRRSLPARDPLLMRRGSQDGCWPRVRFCADSDSGSRATRHARVVPIFSGQDEAQRRCAARWSLPASVQPDGC